MPPAEAGDSTDDWLGMTFIHDNEASNCGDGDKQRGEEATAGRKSGVGMWLGVDVLRRVVVDRLGSVDASTKLHHHKSDEIPGHDTDVLQVPLIEFVRLGRSPGPSQRISPTCRLSLAG